jgi:hypothetical protein
MLTVAAAQRDSIDEHCHPNSRAKCDVHEAGLALTCSYRVLCNGGTGGVIIDYDRHAEVSRKS